MEKCEILGVKISNVTMDAAVNAASAPLTRGAYTIFTPNPEIIMLAQKDREFKEILNNADLLLPDGIGVIIASRLLKKPLPERVPGFDFVCGLLKGNHSVYLLGAKPHVVEAAANKLKQKGVKVAGFHHGYFTDDKSIIEDINNKKPSVLLVCLGAPKQEKWIAKNKSSLPACVCVGAGGSLDVFAGNVKRAPLFMRRLNLEWLYRALRQPERLKRLVIIPEFLFKVLRGG